MFEKVRQGEKTKRGYGRMSWGSRVRMLEEEDGRGEVIFREIPK